MPAWHRLSNRKKFGAITNKWQKDLPTPAKLIKHHTIYNYDDTLLFPPDESKTNFGNFTMNLSLHRGRSTQRRRLFGRRTFENLHDPQLIQINPHGIFRPLGIHVMAKRPPGNSCHAIQLAVTNLRRQPGVNMPRQVTVYQACQLYLVLSQVKLHPERAHLSSFL